MGTNKPNHGDDTMEIDNGNLILTIPKKGIGKTGLILDIALYEKAISLGYTPEDINKALDDDTD